MVNIRNVSTYNGAEAHYLIRGSLKTWHIYIDGALLLLLLLSLISL